jgi:hypothetical protein
MNENQTTNALPESTELLVPESVFNPLEEQYNAKLQAVKDLLAFTGVPTKEQMKLARETRLDLVPLRTNIDRRRKEKGEFHLRAKQNIDGTAKALMAKVSGTEEKLYFIESYEDREKEAKKKELCLNRIGIISTSIEPAFNPYLGKIYDEMLATMPNESFEAMVNGFVASREAREAAVRKLEEERKAKEEAERVENERIRKENEELKKANDERIAKEKAEREELARKAYAEAERKAKIQSERKQIVAPYVDSPWAYDLAAMSEDEFNAFVISKKQAFEEDQKEIARVKAEREAFLKAEAEAKALKDAENKRIMEEAQRIADEKAAADKAAKAPDKEKLLAVAKMVKEISLPYMATEVGNHAAEQISQRIDVLADFIQEKAEEL